MSNGPHLHHRPLKSVHPFVAKHYRYAVVGASSNPEKYGHIVFMDLQRSGFDVVPVNPKLDELGGVRAAARLADIRPAVDVAVVVVPPSIGLTVLDEAVSAGVKKIWFQPGAESAAIREKAVQLGIEVMANGACIMVVRRQIGL